MYKLPVILFFIFSININHFAHAKQVCNWTSEAPPYETKTLTLKQTGTEKKTGKAIYESCVQAKYQAEKEWIKKNYGGYKEDAEDAINKESQRHMNKAKSANEEAKESSQGQKIAGAVTMVGSAVAAVFAYQACSIPKPTPLCPWLIALAAGLGLTSAVLNVTSAENEEVASQYQGSLQNAPQSKYDYSKFKYKKSNIKSDDISIANKNLWKGFKKIKLPNGDIITPNPEKLQAYLKSKGVKWDAKKQTLTLPNGKIYKGTKNINKKLMTNFMKTNPTGKKISKIMNTTQKKIKNNLNSKSTDANSQKNNPSNNKTIAKNTSSGSGGFRGYTARSSNSNSNPNNNLASNSNIYNPKRSPNSDRVKNMFVKSGKDNIGVRQSNIFQMIHKRYQKKRKQQRFIEF